MVHYYESGSCKPIDYRRDILPKDLIALLYDAIDEGDEDDLRFSQSFFCKNINYGSWNQSIIVS